MRVAATSETTAATAPGPSRSAASPAAVVVPRSSATSIAAGSFGLLTETKCLAHSEIQGKAARSRERVNWNDRFARLRRAIE